MDSGPIPGASPGTEITVYVILGQPSIFERALGYLSVQLCHGLIGSLTSGMFEGADNDAPCLLCSWETARQLCAPARKLTYKAASNFASVRACRPSNVSPEIISTTAKPQGVTSSTARLV